MCLYMYINDALCRYFNQIISILDLNYIEDFYYIYDFRFPCFPWCSTGG